MSQAKIGDTVKVHYTGKLEDGAIFDSSKERSPITFTIGEKKLIPAFEKAVIDMQPGATKTEKLSCENAYGPVRNELILNVEKEKIPKDLNPQIGQILKFQKKAVKDSDQAETISFSVIGITNTHIMLDANHPLAGKDLIFEIELLEIAEK